MAVNTLNNQCGLFARFTFHIANQLINLQNLRGKLYPTKMPLKMLQYSADHGHVSAMSQLGSLLFENGVGRAVKRSGLEYVRSAAKNGDVNAQYTLGCAYRSGTMANQDLQQARHWLALAAENGHNRAKELLRGCEQV